MKMTDMRRFLNILNETASVRGGGKKYEFLQSLLEGRKDQYRQMWDILAPLVEFDPSTKPFYDRDFSNALAFGRNDRIVWALKQYRQNFVNEWGTKNYRHAEDPRVAAILRRFPIQSVDRVATRKLRMIEEHFLAIPYSKIQSYVFPATASVDDVYDALLALENEFKERSKGMVTQHEGDKIILKFPDGMCWMHLSRGGCEEEANAMGHCGNGSGRDGETILSLRQPKAELDGVTFYEPFLTFILDADGMLGEMKGKNNDKPVARYHPYIVALLKLPIIHGIKGGGYMPQNNFALSDLPLEERKQLVKEKPELGTFADIVLVEGWTEIAKQKFFTEWNISFGRNTATIAEDGSILYRVARDLSDFVGDYGDDPFKYWMRVVDGDEYLDYDADQSFVELCVDDLPTVQRLWLIGNLKKTIESGGYDIEDEGFEEGDLDDISGRNIVRLARAFDDGLYDELRHAVETGMQYGAEREAVEAIKETVGGIDLIYGTMKPIEDWDAPIEIVLTADDAAEVLSTDDLIGDFRDFYDDGEIELDEPYDGFNDFDKDAVVERINAMIPRDEEIRPPKGLLQLDRPHLLAFLKELTGKLKATRSGIFGFREDGTDAMLRSTLVRAVKTYYGVDLEKQAKAEAEQKAQRAQAAAED